MRNCAAVFVALLLGVSIAFAQANTNQENTFSSTLSGGIHLRAIAGVPFSADVVKQSTRRLSDGTQVPVVIHGKMFRDSEGRTRSEAELMSAKADQPRQYVIIVDPLQHVNIALDPQNKTATITSLPETLKSAQPAKMAAGGQTGADRIPAQTHALLGAEDLGTSTVEGFHVAGTRFTRLTEETANMVVESWFSPELKIELQTRIAGPRFGETITKLENIIAAEPDPALFEIPADYTVKTIPPVR